MFKQLTAAAIVASVIVTPAVLAGDNDSKKENHPKKSRSAAKHGKRTASNQPPSIKQGKALYKAYQCFDCHKIEGKGCKEGYALDKLGSKRSKNFIREHILDPDKHFDKEVNAFNVDLNLMPPQNLENWEVDSLVEYLHSLK